MGPLVARDFCGDWWEGWSDMQPRIAPELMPEQQRRTGCTFRAVTDRERQ
jgi:hypothetical protein